MIRSNILLFLCLVLFCFPAFAVGAVSPAVNTGSVLDDGPVKKEKTTPAKATAKSSASGNKKKAEPAKKKAPRPKPAAKTAETKTTTTSTAAATGTTEAARVARQLARKDATSYKGTVDPSWKELVERLKKDPKVPDVALRYFTTMQPYSADPMGVKIRELYNSAYGKRKTTSKPRARVWAKLLTKANMDRCNAFLTKYKTTFDAVEKKYPVPRETLAALLFVETRLGNYIGKENALWSLACMAASTTPQKVQDGISDIPLTNEHAAWLQAKLTDKSDWAYKELKAFLTYCNVQELDPSCMPGSVYGAIGICQFMPSNLAPYGDDGDGDGIVNLFNEPDAIFSAAKYLTKHGWAKGINAERQRKTIKRYNNLNVYANTIMALAESLRTGVLQSAPPDMKGEIKAPGKSKAKKKTVKKSGTAPKTKKKATAKKTSAQQAQ